MRRKRVARLLRKLRAMRKSLPPARFTAAASRRRQERSRASFRVREDSDAASGPGGRERLGGGTTFLRLDAPQAPPLPQATPGTEGYLPTRFSDLMPIGPISCGLVRATSIGNPPSI